MAARPWWPLPSGSKGEGPIGVLHDGVVGEEVEPGLAVAGGHGGPGADAELAGGERFVGHVGLLASLGSADLGDDVVGEAAQVVDLGLERLGVLLGAVGPAEADDDVGDAELLRAA